MDSSKHLAVESFSDSWLSKITPSLDGLDESLEVSLDIFCEETSKRLEYEIVMSKKFPGETHNFNFNIPISEPQSLAHADELFSNGFIKPGYVDQANLEAFNSPKDASSSSIASTPSIQFHYCLLGRWRRSSERILRKCLRYLTPICCIVESSKKGTRVDDIDRRVRQVDKWCSSAQASPQQHVNYSAVEWCHIESSIYEAVLHCKRSIEE